MVLGLGKQRCLPCAKALLPASPILRPAVPRLLTLSRNAPFFVNVTFFAFAQSHTANLRFFHNASFFHSRSRLSSSRSPAFLCVLPNFSASSVFCFSAHGFLRELCVSAVIFLPFGSGIALSSAVLGYPAEKPNAEPRRLLEAPMRVHSERKSP